MSRVLVLSRHKGQLDRRIIAEINTLIASGRDVTLVSVPTVIPETCFDGPVRIVMPSVAGAAASMTERIKRMAHRLPAPLEDLATMAWDCLHLSSLHLSSLSNYFIQLTPREKFDVIHCHDLDTLPAGVKLRDPIAPGAKLIYDSHELFPFQFKRGTKRQKYWSMVEETYIKESDLVITVNESISRELARLYSIASPEVLYNSCEGQRSTSRLDEHAFLQHFGASPGGFRVMFQGNLIREKNLENLVTAFQYLEDSVQLFLLGDGPIAARLKMLCVQLRLSNVFFGPWAPQADLLSYVSHAHLGIIPYVGDDILNNLYCTPNKLFEFIEAGIPICANDLPELRQIVAGNGIGGVYPMGNPEAIAQAIEACRSRYLRGEFVLSTLHAVREKFAWARQGQKLLELYDKLDV